MKELSIYDLESLSGSDNIAAFCVGWAAVNAAVGVAAVLKWAAVTTPVGLTLAAVDIACIACIAYGASKL